MKNGDEIKAEFRKLRRRQLFIMIPTIAIAFIFALYAGTSPNFQNLTGRYETLCLIIFLAAFLLLSTFSVYNWRCPSCKKYLGKSLNPAYCERCGAKLH